MAVVLSLSLVWSGISGCGATFRIVSPTKHSRPGPTDAAGYPVVIEHGAPSGGAESVGNQVAAALIRTLPEWNSVLRLAREDECLPARLDVSGTSSVGTEVDPALFGKAILVAVTLFIAVPFLRSQQLETQTATAHLKLPSGVERSFQVSTKGEFLTPIFSSSGVAMHADFEHALADENARKIADALAAPDLTDVLRQEKASQAETPLELSVAGVESGADGPVVTILNRGAVTAVGVWIACAAQWPEGGTTLTFHSKDPVLKSIPPGASVAFTIGKKWFKQPPPASVHCRLPRSTVTYGGLATPQLCW